ncbi:MAG: N-acetylmuramoyl-L-alanine amidase [Thiobacillaceae bacterium]|nr:N-acetylmuramoyl-L-alanine amidase [Thiobacillaceae bacterium]
MKIRKHRLLHEDGSPVRFEPTPNMGGLLKPEYLILHYTAGGSLDGSIAWFKNPHAKASAHLVIGRDGAIVQMVPFNRVAWHAGVSTWDGRHGLNTCSIGIELDNAGPMERVGGRWVAKVSKRPYPDDDVLVANHQHDPPGTAPSGWHEYGEVQIERALMVAQLLMERYALQEVLGHDDVSPGRKMDPGPAFPMASFRARLLGRREDTPAIYAARTALNLRAGPGVQHAALPGSPLPAGTRFYVLEKQAVWWQVELIEPPSDELAEGWVHSNFVVPAA